MKNTTGESQNLPAEIATIKSGGFVTWSSDNSLSTDFRNQFDAERIPVLGIRQVQVWGLQVDDERELPGHERTNIPSEELWEIILQAKDGSRYNVNSTFVEPAGEK